MTNAYWFEDNVNRYDSWFERHGSAYESEIEALRPLVKIHGKGLEIGVGTGRFAAPLGIGFGIDPSRNMGKTSIKRDIEVIQGVGENLPLKESCVDAVLMVTTICFLDDVPGALKEAYRVLKAEGCIVIGFVDRESLLGRVYERNKRDNVFYRPATFFSADEIVAYLKRAGFEDFIFRQTIFKNPEEMKENDPVKPGYGEGSFVVVRGKKGS